MTDWKNVAKAKAIEKKNRERILAVNPHVDEKSGIYFLTRTDEDGFRYAYIGQLCNVYRIASTYGKRSVVV